MKIKIIKHFTRACSLNNPKHIIIVFLNYDESCPESIRIAPKLMETRQRVEATACLLSNCEPRSEVLSAGATTEPPPGPLTAGM